jgi:hypothetical protein
VAASLVCALHLSCLGEMLLAISPDPSRLGLCQWGASAFCLVPFSWSLWWGGRPAQISGGGRSALRVSPMSEPKL